MTRLLIGASLGAAGLLLAIAWLLRGQPDDWPGWPTFDPNAPPT